MSLCKFRNIGGKPREGIHAWRIPSSGGPNSLAAADLGLTALAAVLINLFLSKGEALGQWTLGFLLVFLALWALGVVLHALFCVETPITRAIFPKRVSTS